MLYRTIASVVLAALVVSGCGRGLPQAARTGADDVLRSLDDIVRAGANQLDDATRLPTSKLDDIDDLLRQFDNAGELATDDLLRQSRLREARAALLEAQRVQAAVDGADSLIAQHVADATAQVRTPSLPDEFVADLNAVAESIVMEQACEVLLSVATDTPPPPIDPAESVRDAVIGRLAERWAPGSLVNALDWTMWASSLQERTRFIADELATGGPALLYQTQGATRVRAAEVWIRYCLPGR